MRRVFYALPKEADRTIPSSHSKGNGIEAITAQNRAKTAVEG
jgi:hypothetical protein